MGIILVKIWMGVLVVLDIMLIVQAVARAVRFFRKNRKRMDWTPYNRIMLGLLAAAFFPVTLCYLYIRKA